MYFRNYGLWKTCLDNCLKNLVWGNPLRGNMVNGPKHWVNITNSTFTIFFDHCERMSWKKSILGTWKVLRLFVNSLLADNKYSLLSRDNSMRIIQIHLSQKQKNFSQFFCAFCKSSLNFEHFQKNVTLIAHVFLNLQTPKDVVR